MSFDPPSNWTRITTIDAHTAGEPLRVIAYRNRADGIDFETYNLSGDTVITDAFAIFRKN